jgi:Domain of unknown function DUF11
MATSTTLTRLARVVIGALGIAIAAAGAGAVGPVSAQERVSVEKYVAAVNAAAPADPAAVVLASGDTVTYGIGVTSNPSLGGAEVTVTDVFDPSALTFEGAEPAGCSVSGGEVSCLVTLDDEGSTEVLLTFAVVGSTDAGGCRAIVNTATVEADGAEASAERSVDVCAAGAVGEGTAGGAGGGAGTSAGRTGSGVGTSDTAAELPNAFSALAIQLGALLVGVAIVSGLHSAAGIRERATGDERT